MSETQLVADFEIDDFDSCGRVLKATVEKIVGRDYLIIEVTNSIDKTRFVFNPRRAKELLDFLVENLKDA